MEETKKTDNRLRILYFILLAGAAAGAAFAANRLLPGAAKTDPFDGVAGLYGAALAAGRLFLPSACAFLAVYLFAHSPFAIPVSVGVLAGYGAISGVSFFAALSSPGNSGTAAAIALALSALCLVLFGVRCCELSPEVRRLRFSGFDGRREAARLALSFFTHSGAAALFLAAAALIIHFGS